MSENGLPCLDLLEATPEILRGLMAELSDEDVRWKPAPDRFSVGEVLAHLSHSESHCYRARLDRFMAEEQPEFEPDDAQFHVERYRNADPEDEFDHFEEQRQSNVEFLRDLPAAAGAGGLEIQCERPERLIRPHREAWPTNHAGDVFPSRGISGG